MIITIGSGGSGVELIFSAFGFGRIADADEGSLQNHCSGVGNKIHTNFVAPCFLAESIYSGAKGSYRTDLFLRVILSGNRIHYGTLKNEIEFLYG